MIRAQHPQLVGQQLLKRGSRTRRITCLPAPRGEVVASRESVGVIGPGTRNAALKGKLVPTVVAIALIVSQPLHLVSVIVGLPVLDLFAWGMTALGMAFLAARLVRNV